MLGGRIIRPQFRRANSRSRSCEFSDRVERMPGLGQDAIETTAVLLMYAERTFRFRKTGSAVDGKKLENIVLLAKHFRGGSGFRTQIVPCLNGYQLLANCGKRTWKSEKSQHVDPFPATMNLPHHTFLDHTLEQPLPLAYVDNHHGTPSLLDSRSRRHGCLVFCSRCWKRADDEQPSGRGRQVSRLFPRCLLYTSPSPRD